MEAWRIFDHRAVHARAADFNPLLGEGGLYQRGRWHHKGQRILYTSGSPSTALLEVLVHETSESFRERTLLHIELTQNVERVPYPHLVRLLADAPSGNPERLTRDFGSKWLAEERSLALVVPSIAMPLEFNVIINPGHPAANSLRILNSQIITLDRRLISSLDDGSRTDPE